MFQMRVGIESAVRALRGAERDVQVNAGREAIKKCHTSLIVGAVYPHCGIFPGNL
jgi:hypothetical protein